MTNGGFRSGGKISSAGDGRVIRIINADEQHLQERVLLNLKTTQPFEEVLIDLGQVNFINFNKLLLKFACPRSGSHTIED